MHNPIAFSAAALMLAACAPDAPDAPPDPAGTSAALEADVDRCVRFRERAHHCRAALVDPWVRARAAARPDVAAALATEVGAAELRRVALAEFEADGAGPLGPRRARCAAVAAELPEALRPFARRMDACEVRAGCAAWTRCVVPVFERMLAAPRR